MIPANSAWRGPRVLAGRLPMAAMFLTAALGALLTALPSRTGAAEAGRYAVIDRHALAAPASAARSVDSLVAYLVRPARTDEEKARALFRWIAEQIAYDAERFFRGQVRSAGVTPEQVLHARKAVCDGYATLFEAMARKAGLEARKVTGHARGFGYRVGQPLAGPADHAWNAVRLGGRWRLLDATWAAGYLDAADRRFHRRFEPFFFLPAPDDLLYSHLPEDARWQLGARPIGPETFVRRALLRPAFFRLGLALGDHPDAHIAADDRVTVRLRTPAGLRLLAAVLQGERELGRDLTLIPAGTGTVQAVFPAPGDYVLRVYARQGEAEGRYDWALDYRVQARAGTDFRFPRFGDAFYRLGLATESHTAGTIAAAERLTVRLRVPADVLLTAQLEQGERPVPGTPVLVQREAPGQATVDVRFPAPGRYALRLFAKPKRQAGPLAFALDYAVVASAAAPGGFPTVFTEFGTRGAVLHEPLQGELAPGSQVRFRLRVPGAAKVAVVSGGTWFPLQRSGEEFAGAATIQAGETQVFAQFPGTSQYSGLLAYRGRR